MEAVCIYSQTTDIMFEVANFEHGGASNGVLRWGCRVVKGNTVQLLMLKREIRVQNVQHICNSLKHSIRSPLDWQKFVTIFRPVNPEFVAVTTNRLLTFGLRLKKWAFPGWLEARGASFAYTTQSLIRLIRGRCLLQPLTQSAALTL